MQPNVAQYVIVGLLVIVGMFIAVYAYRRGKRKKVVLLALQAKEQDDLRKWEVRVNELGDTFKAQGLPTIQSDLKLKKAEQVHTVLKNVDWQEFRKERTGWLAAHGITGRIKIAKGIYYRYGAGQVMNESRDILKTIDSGDLYFTSRGIIFNGGFGNKTLPFDKVLKLNFFRNGIVIERETGKDVSIQFNFREHPEKLVTIMILWEGISQA
jgi:hypothetical protein